MTKRKNVDDGHHSQLELNQYRLREIALKLKDGVVLSSPHREFLAGALWGIGQGDDANEVLGVKAKRGERRTAEQVAKRDRIRFPLSWVAAVIRPVEEGGKGMALDDALAAAAQNFRLNEDTVRTGWHSNPKLRSLSFDRPISSLPDVGQR
jgi:hypothetical protein